MQEATLAGNGHEGSKVVPRHGHCCNEFVNSFNDAFGDFQRSPMTDVKTQDSVSRVVHHQCGFHGCQVGEAVQPKPSCDTSGKAGPKPSKTPMSTFHRTKEPLVRPNTGRDVIAEVEDSIVLATSSGTEGR